MVPSMSGGTKAQSSAALAVTTPAVLLAASMKQWRKPWLVPTRSSRAWGSVPPGQVRPVGRFPGPSSMARGAELMISPKMPTRFLEGSAAALPQ